MFYGILANSRRDNMYDLVLDDDGKIEIYGVKHTEKISKIAKI